MKFSLVLFLLLIALAEIAGAATCSDCHEGSTKVIPEAVTTTTTKAPIIKDVVTTTVTVIDTPTKVITVTTVTAKVKTKPEPPLGKTVVTNAKKYLKLRERTNHNDAPDIDKFMKYVGLNNPAQYKSTGTGYSWCAGFVLYNYFEACSKLKIDQTLPKTAGVANLWNKTRANPIRYRTIPASQVRLGLIKLQPGDIIIWKHGYSAFTLGHTGMNEEQLTMTEIFSIEGNTSGSGLSREGGGVFENKRIISATGSMQIVGFIRPIVSLN
jgi:hypothetical protein